MADILTAGDGVNAPPMGAGTAVGSASASMAASPEVRRSDFEGAFTSRAKNLVKGVGHVTNNGIPLDDVAHAGEIITKSHQAILDVRTATMRGAWDTDSVMSGMSQDFWNNSQMLAAGYQARKDASIRKAFSATNLGLGGVPYGLVPFDLLAPSRLIYPVYTLFRNKFPRPAGQGSSRQVYGLLGRHLHPGACRIHQLPCFY